jgi:hypothetical protein
MTKANAASLSEWASAGPNQLVHGQAVGERGAEVAVEEAGDPIPVLDEDRLVRPQLVVELVDGGLGGEVSEFAAGDVAGKQVRAHEDEDAEEKQRDGCETEPGEEEPRHRRSYRLCGRSRAPAALLRLVQLV